MSEYQYIAFRAIDGPVSEENLEYMRRQSSRAEITPWSFDNEYHYGDFRGDATEMLRRGYDFHFHYANFGIRTLMMRLASGLPDANAAAPYFEDDSLFFKKDRRGPGGILRIEPCFEPGYLDDLWDLDELVGRLLPLRGEILDGDMRPLYLARLAVATDMNHDPKEEKDAPVPAGLGELTHAQRALAELYGLGDSLIAAAAQDTPELPKRNDIRSQYEAWLQRQPEATKTAWLAQLMADPHSAVRREMVAEFHRGQSTSSWPAVRVDRTVADLLAAAETIQRDADRRAGEKAARDRAKKLAAMAADPEKTLRETEKLVKKRGSEAYEQIATLLTDLRAALAGTDRAGLAEEQARKLRQNNPRLHGFVGELRRRGLLPK